MRNGFRQVKWQNKIVIAAILPALFALMIQGIVSYQSSIKLMKEETIRNNNRIILDAGDKVYQLLRDMEMTLLGIYSDPDMLYAMEKLVDGTGTATVKTTSLAKDLFYQLGYQLDIYGIYVYQPNLQLMSSYAYANNLYPSNLFSKTEVFQTDMLVDIMNSPDTTTQVQWYDNAGSGKNTLRMVVKVRNLFTAKQLALVVIDMGNTRIQKILESYRLQPEQVFLISKQEEIIYADDLGNQTSGIDNLQAARVRLARPEKDELVVSSELPKYGLTLNTIIPLAYIPKSLSKTLFTMLAVVFLLMVGVLLLTWIISVSLAKPILHLRDDMKAVEQGDLSRRAKIETSDEIGTLAHSFNRMLTQLELLIERELKANLLRQHAELKALQAQINPHFLYNTLATMGQIAESQHVSKVQYMCEALVAFYRYSNQTGQATASLLDEVQQLENYIFIQNTRTPDAYILRVRIQPEVMHFQVPRLMLQPLIENAIMHGLGDKNPPRMIKVTALRRYQYVQVCIIDNGLGMSAQHLRSLERELREEDIGLDRSSSIGLVNVNCRLRLLMGDGYKMRILSKQNKGTMVVLQLPLPEETQ